MQRKTLTVCVALVVLALVAVAGTTSALYTGDADQSSLAQQAENYDGSNEPDNPDCPPPDQYSDYSEFGHECASPNDPAPGDHPEMYGDDYTDVKWNSHWFFYGQGQHEPGYEGASYAFRSWPVKEQFDLEYFEYVAIYAPWGQFGGDSAGTCTVADTQAAGLDRGNDGHGGDFHSTGGGGDDSLVSSIQNSGVDSNYGYFQFAGPDDFGDRNIPLNSSDAFVAALGDCWANPEEPGWYRMTVWFNGTDYNGNKVEWKGWNHWQYFCSDCESRQDAIDKFGPPGTNPDNPWKDTTVSKQSSSDPTPTDTVTPTSAGDDSDDSEPTPTPTSASDDGGDSTATPTPPPGETPTSGSGQDDTDDTDDTDAPSPGATDSPSPTEGSDGGASTPTQSPDSTADGGSGDTATRQGQGTDSGSPTAQGGPGFGIVATLLGVLLAVWTARRS